MKIEVMTYTISTRKNLSKRGNWKLIIQTRKYNWGFPTEIKLSFLKSFIFLMKMFDEKTMFFISLLEYLSFLFPLLSLSLISFKLN